MATRWPDVVDYLVPMAHFSEIEAKFRHSPVFILESVMFCVVYTATRSKCAFVEEDADGLHMTGL